MQRQQRVHRVNAAIFIHIAGEDRLGCQRLLRSDQLARRCVHRFLRGVGIAEIRFGERQRLFKGFRGFGRIHRQLVHRIGGGDRSV